MKLELNKNNISILHYQLAHAMTNNDLEYEIVFNNSLINYDKFYSLINRCNKLKKKYKLINNGTEELDIFLPKNIRITLHNKEDIISYCKNNIIKKEYKYSILNKNSYKWDNEIQDKLKSKTKKGNYYANFNDFEYGLRSNLKTEINCKTNPLYKNKKEIINITNPDYFKKLKKYFRFKKRYSYKSIDNLFQIDLTIVKESKNKEALYFHKSGTLENTNIYEVEIEYIGNKNYNKNELINSSTKNMILSNNEFKICKSSLYKHIGVISQVLQNSFYIISKTEANIVNTIYQHLLSKIIRNRLEDKLSILQKLIKLKDNKQVEEFYKDVYPTSKLSANIRDFIDILGEKYKDNNTKFLEKVNRELVTCKKLLRSIRLRNNPSPKPITMELNNLDEGEQVNIISIEKEFGNIGTLYTVTDKAEGEGNILYILGISEIMKDKDEKEKIETKFFNKNENECDKKLREMNGKVYMIDSNNNIIFTGCKIETLSKQNTILNGEFMRENKNKKLLNRYLAYDIYYSNNKDLIELPLMVNYNERDKIESRLDILSKYIDSIVDKKHKINPLILFGLSIKKFYLANSKDNKSIYKQSKLLWSNYENETSEINYTLDGMIYTPANYPVGYIPMTKTSELKINYYDIQIGRTWEYNLKWKPSKDNSIDFLVKFEKDANNKDIIIPEYNNNNVKYYKKVNLYCGGFKYNNICNTNIKFIKNRKGIYQAIKFIPLSPYDNEAYIAYLEIDKKGNIIDKWNNMIIEDDTIVEFVYKGFDSLKPDYIKNKFLRWVPLRTRHDKTQTYKIGINKKNRIINILDTFLIKKKELVNYLLYILKQIRTDESEKIEKELIKINKSNNRQEVLLLLSELITTFSNNLYNEINKVENSMRFPEKTKIYSNFNYKLIQFRKLVLSIKNYKLTPFKSYLEEILVSLTNEYNINILSNLENNIHIKMQFGNNYETANSNWKNIHNPVTNKMITTGENIISSKDYYANTELLQIRNQSPNIKLRKFHNFVKDQLLKNIIKLVKRENKEISLLEFACGKAQDLHKWRKYNIKNIVGIDISNDNIENSINGACARYINCINKYPNCSLLKNVNFLVADIGKNLENGDAFSGIKNSSFYNNKYEKLWNINPINYKQNKFNLISIQFALHYLCKNKEILSNLIKNIADNIKEGGYIIGTCFDGKVLWNELNDLNIYDSIVGKNEDKDILWKITKKYKSDIDTLPNNEHSLNYPIHVYVSSIKKGHDEYLVNFDYIKMEFLKYNIKLLQPSEEKQLDNLDINGKFEDIYNNIYKNKNLSESDKKFSFLNRYFIFKKHKDIDDSIIMEKIYDEIINKKRGKKDKKTFLHLINKIKQESKNGINTFIIYLKNYFSNSNEYKDISETKREKYINYIIDKIKDKNKNENENEKSNNKNRIDVLECLRKMKILFNEYELFLKGVKPIDDFQIELGILGLSSPEIIEKCFEEMDNFDMYNIDLFNKELYQYYFSDYKERKSLDEDNIKPGNVLENKEILVKNIYRKYIIICSELSKDFIKVKSKLKDKSFYKDTKFYKYIRRSTSSIEYTIHTLETYFKILKNEDKRKRKTNKYYNLVETEYNKYGVTNWINSLETKDSEYNLSNNLKEWSKNFKEFIKNIPSTERKLDIKKKILKNNKKQLLKTQSIKDSKNKNNELYISTIKELEPLIKEYIEYKEQKTNKIKLEDLKILISRNEETNTLNIITYMKVLRDILDNKLVISEDILDLTKINYLVKEYNELRIEIEKKIKQSK